MVSEKEIQASRAVENDLALAKERRLTGDQMGTFVYEYLRPVPRILIRERVENRTEARGIGADMLHRYYCDEELVKRLWRTP
jgi:hypothetical protein